MSSTLENGEAEQHAVEDESAFADLPDETVLAAEQSTPLHEQAVGHDEDVDTIPQLEAQDITENLDHTSAQMVAGSRDVPHLQPAIQLIGSSPRPASLDDSASIPDDTPSLQNSGVSSPRSEHQLLQPVISRKNSTASRRPFELRFQSRLSNSYSNTPRAVSPAFLNIHSRQTSLASFAPPSESAADDLPTPWEVIRWTRLRRLTGQVFSEIGRRNFGNPTCLAVTDHIVIGTSKGLILVFDHHQTSKAIIGSGTKAAEAGPVTSLAISADHTAIAAGHATGHIFTWELSRASRPFMQISAIDATSAEARKGDGHVHGSAVVHIGFLGYRRTALASADDKGMAFSHLATRGTGSLGRSVKTVRILGRYPELLVRKASKPVKKSSVLAFSPLPLGNVEQKTDALGLVAMLTPFLLVVVSTTPIAQTQHKSARPKEVAAHSAMTAALAWFPAIKLKGTNSDISKNKLAYVWSNVLNVLEVEEVPREPDTPEDKPIELLFVSKCHYRAEEAIVAVQWLSRSVIALLTITQQLLILEDGTMNVTDSFDLLPKNIYHADLYSHQLQSVIEDHNEEDISMHGVVADGYYMSFRCHKGRLFLLGSNDVWWGSLTNWADRLLAMMEAGDFIGAIRVATNYYVGSGEKVTIGLPEDDELRSSLVREKLHEMISASLRYAFGKNEQSDGTGLDQSQLRDLAVVCILACLKMNEKDFLFEEVFDWYDDNNVGEIFVDVLESHILDREINTLPPAAVKTLISHFAQTHAPAQLEEIICLLDATLMDVDQVTTLCKQHNLYDAYIYVWNTALMDYTTPVLELLEMSDQSFGNGISNSVSSKSVTSQKVFPYLSFALTGRIYPIGEFMDEDRAMTAKTQIYELFFYGNHGSKDSFSTLRKILRYDTSSFMAVMNEAFEDSALNTSQDDFVENKSAFSQITQQSSLFNRQIIVRILLDVMSSGFDTLDHIFLDMFIARNLPKYPQYMLLSGTTMKEVFTRLCEYNDSGLHDDAQLSLEYLMTVYKPANLSTFIPLLQAAHFYRILKSVYRQECDWVQLFRVYLDDVEDQAQIFDIILEGFREPTILDEERRMRFVAEIKQCVMALATIDIDRLAKVIDHVLPSDHAFFLENLEDPRLQFQYLRALLDSDDGLPKSQHATIVMLEQYVRLLCQFDATHVVEYITSMKEGALHLEEVMPALEDSGNIDAAVVLLAQQGQVQDAMNRLTKHLTGIEATLMGILDNAAESLDEVATNEAIEDLLSSIDKYAKIGIWLCSSQKLAKTKARVPNKSPKRSTVKQPLSFEETLWLEFIVAIVAIAQKVGPISTPSVNTDADELSLSLRNSIQQVFTALLNSTTATRSQAQSDSLQFVRILRAFLTRASEISPSLSHLRYVMSSIFSAYAYEESLLSLSNAMLDKDLFVQVDEVAKLRQIGWRPRGQVCGLCRRRVWGPGSGLQIWESWQRKEKDRAKRSEEQRRQIIVESLVDDDARERGKGKAAASHQVLEDDDVGFGDLKHVAQTSPSPLVVFSCRHVFHRECLDQSQNLDVDRTVISVGTVPEDHSGKVRLICPSCL